MADTPRVRFSADETKRWWDGVEKRLSSAAVFCETDDGRLLVVKANYKKHWTMPGGIVDERETPKQAAIRETYEEVGLTLAPDDVQFRAVVDRVSGSVGHTYQFIFETKISAEQVASIQLQTSEIDEYALVSRDEVVTEDRVTGRWFGKAIFHWVENKSGYIEQTFSYDD